MSTPEAKYQAGLIKRIKVRFPGCMVLKNDPVYQQGVPDLSVFHGLRWGALEVKASATAGFQPNQQHYLSTLDDMSFAAMICPENEEEVLAALERALTS